MRVFKCDDCAHKMRFSGRLCGKCYTEKAFWQKDSTYYWIVVTGLFLIVAILVLLGDFLEYSSAGLPEYPGSAKV